MYTTYPWRQRYTNTYTTWHRLPNTAWSLEFTNQPKGRLIPMCSTHNIQENVWGNCHHCPNIITTSQQSCCTIKLLIEVCIMMRKGYLCPERLQTDFFSITVTTAIQKHRREASCFYDKLCVSTKRSLAHGLLHPFALPTQSGPYSMFHCKYG